MNTSTSTRLGQILLDKNLITAEQLDIALGEQQRRRQLVDSDDKSLKLSLGEILIELGFIDRLQLKRGLNWQLMLRKVAIVMSFCAPLMTLSSGALAGSNIRPSFTAQATSSSVAKVTPSFTKTSSSVSSAPAYTPSLPAKVSSSSSSKSSQMSSKSSSQASVVNLKIAEVAVIESAYDHVQVRWVPASTDNIQSFRVFRDQVLIEVLDSSDFYFDDFNVAADRNYVYGVSVGDSAGNWSPVKSVLVKTQPAPKGVEVVSSSSSLSSTAASRTSASSSSLASQANSSIAASANSSSKAQSSMASSISSKPLSSSSSAKSVNSTASSSSVSSTPVSSSSSSLKSSVASTSSSSNSSSSSSSARTSTVTGPVSFSWLAPELRENGNFLDITELGGYELRYKKTTDNAFTYVTISDAWKNYHNFTWLEGTYIFQVAAFDKNGLYSNFVDIEPQ